MSDAERFRYYAMLKDIAHKNGGNNPTVAYEVETPKDRLEPRVDFSPKGFDNMTHSHTLKREVSKKIIC